MTDKDTSDAARDAAASKLPAKVVQGAEEQAPEPAVGGSKDWISGLSKGLQEKARKLLGQVPPEVRKNLINQAREHGPRAALAAVDAAARRARGPRAKLALYALNGLLKKLDSGPPKK